MLVCSVVLYDSISIFNAIKMILFLYLVSSSHALNGAVELVNFFLLKFHLLYLVVADI